MNKQIHLNWLRSFDAATRYSSFTRAAQELNLTQAAVSKQIKSLELQLQCQLFHRHAHGLELTEQGRRYWNDTHELIRQLDDVSAQFINRRQSHKIHLRCNISYSALVLSEQLSHFRQLHPNISIQLTHDIWEPASPSHNAHIEIGYRSLKQGSHREYQHVLPAGQLFPVVANGLTLPEVAILPLIHVAGYYDEWYSWIKKARQLMQPSAEDGDCLLLERSAGSRRRNDWFVDNSLSAYQLAAQGQGIALGRDGLIQGMLNSGQLQKVYQQYSLPAGEGFVIKLTDQGVEHSRARTLFDYLINQNTSS